jgi:hypothetical protein
MDKRTLDFGDCAEVGGQQYALNLYTLAESIKARTVLEIGAGWGWSARAFALSLAPRGGFLVSIDPHPERIKPENRGRISALEVPWEICKARSEDTPFNERIDLLYIDGDPRNAAADYRHYYENVRDGGLIVLDGVGGQPGPTEFVESCEFDFLRLPYNDAYCHAIYRKPVPLAHEGKYEASCTQCPQTFRADYWSALDTAIDSHISVTQHTVNAMAGPRRIKYIKRAR